MFGSPRRSKAQTTTPLQLLAAIEAEALDPSSNLPTTLRKCLTLGGITGSSKLREWASFELRGYRGHEELPEYRQMAAPLLMDSFVGGGIAKNQNVPWRLIPDFARDTLTEGYRWTTPISQAIDLATAARQRGEQSTRIGIPEGTALIAVMNSTLASQGQSGQIERVYWDIDISALDRVVDVVRTILVELVAEIRAGMVVGQTSPSVVLVDQAFAVAIHGDNNRVTFVHASDNAQVMMATDTSEPESKLRKVMYWVGGFIGIAAGAAGIFAVFHP